VGGPRRPFLTKLLTSSKLADFLYAYLLLPVAIQLQLPNNSYPNTVAGWYAEGGEKRALYEDSVARLTALVDEHGVPAGFYLLPIAMSRRDPYPLQSMNDLVATIFAGNGVRIHQILDAYTTHPKDELVLHAFDRHPNAFASGLLADEITENLMAERAFLEIVKQSSHPR
jgi:hypothetical protein